MPDELHQYRMVGAHLSVPFPGGSLSWLSPLILGGHYPKGVSGCHPSGEVRENAQPIFHISPPQRSCVSVSSPPFLLWLGTNHTVTGAITQKPDKPFLQFP